MSHGLKAGPSTTENRGVAGSNPALATVLGQAPSAIKSSRSRGLPIERSKTGIEAPGICNVPPSSPSVRVAVTSPRFQVAISPLM